MLFLGKTLRLEAMSCTGLRGIDLAAVLSEGMRLFGVLGPLERRDTSSGRWDSVVPNCTLGFWAAVGLFELCSGCSLRDSVLQAALPCRQPLPSTASGMQPFLSTGITRDVLPKIQPCICASQPECPLDTAWLL